MLLSRSLQIGKEEKKLSVYRLRELLKQLPTPQGKLELFQQKKKLSYFSSVTWNQTIIINQTTKRFID